MCRTIFRTPSNTCICAVIILQFIIAVTLAVALFIRFYVYQTQVYTSMPNDMRVVGKEPSSIFCSSHHLLSYLTDTYYNNEKKKDLNSNSHPQFDVYLLNEDPEKRNLTIEKPFSYSGNGEMTTGMFQYNVFHLLPQSNISIHLCTRYLQMFPALHNEIQQTGLYVYVLQGKLMFENYMERVKNNPNKPPCTGEDCPPYVQVTPSANCTTLPYLLNTTSQEKDDYYIFYANSDKTDMVQIFTIEYNITRTAYNLSGVSPIQEHITHYRDYKLHYDQWIVVQFNQISHANGLQLYNIHLEYSCTSHMLVYLAIFFFAPLCLIILLVVLLMCCNPSRDAGQRLFNVTQEEEVDHGLLHSGYGSNDAAYH